MLLLTTWVTVLSPKDLPQAPSVAKTLTFRSLGPFCRIANTMGRAPRRRTGRRPETYDLQLVRLLHRIGMEPRKTLLRTRAADDSLVQTLRSEFIESDESFEAAIIDLLEESLDFLKTWEVTDGVADVFVRIQGKVEWTKNIKVNVIMELYHNVVVSRLNSKRLELQNPDFESTEACQLAVAVDLLMEDMNGIDDFLHEVKCKSDNQTSSHRCLDTLR